MKRYLLINAILILFSSGLFAQNEREDLRATLSRDSILIGDRVEWMVRFDLKEGEEYMIQPPAEPVAAGIETVAPLSIDTLSAKKNRLDIEGKIILTSFDSGSYNLPQLVALVRRTNGRIDTLCFDGPLLAVNTIPVDTATYEIKDIKGQIGYPVTFKELLPWFGLLLLVAALAYAIWRFIKYRRENRTFFGKPIVKDPPHVVALRNIDKIRKQKLWQNNKQKQFYTAITEVLRVYIAGRFGISALERPSGEMLADLRKQDVTDKQYDEMAELFGRADLVKFAKYSATEEENEEVIPTAVRFVNDTFMKELEDNKKEE